MRSRPRLQADLADLQDEVWSDTFLADWLVQTNADSARFDRDTANSNNEVKERLAAQAGFRTWASLRACQRDGHRALVLFANDPIFQNLWQRLRAFDEELGWGPKLYGPHNGGVPMTLMRSIETWHQVPKFTKAELRRHYAKIGRLCDELGALLTQVTPGGLGDNFATLTLSEAGAIRLFDCFASPKKRRNRYGSSDYFVKRNAEELLQIAGVTPLGAVQSIKQSTASLGFLQLLPTKVKSPTAFRTYLILEVCDAVNDLGEPISDELIADVVGLLCQKDCSADDVRKARELFRRRRQDGLKAIEAHILDDDAVEDVAPKA